MRRRLMARAQQDEPADQPVSQVETRPSYNILQKGAFKRCIYKLQANDVSITSIRKLLDRLRRDMNYKGNPATLRRLLQELGIHPVGRKRFWDHFLENKRTLMDRAKYLQKVNSYRNEGRPIIYTAVSCVKFPRKDKDMLEDRAVMAYASSPSGIIHNATTVFRYNMPSDEWYYLIRYDRYENWIQTDLLPNIPPKSVIVMRTTPWNKPSVTKGAMEAWLRERCIPFDSSMSKTELRKLIILNKDKDEHKTIDEIIKDNGHTVLRLPHFYCDLNPLEVVWMHLHEHAAEANVTNNDHLVRFIFERLSSIDGYQMTDYYHKTTFIETEYRISDLYAEIIKNRVIIQQSIASLNAANMNVESAEKNVCGGDENEEENSDANSEKSVAN